MIKYNYAAGFLVIAALFIISCTGNSIKVADVRPRYEIPDSLMKTIEIDTVVTCPQVNALTFSGKVSFNDEKVARIFPLVSGNIMNIRVQMGDYVTKGQVLGVIRSGEMAGYGNDLVTSKTNLLIAKKNMDASEDMYKSGLMSQKDFITAQAMYKQAEAQLNHANQILQINGGNTQGAFVVKAPISGFIVEKLVTNNMSIRADNQNSLFTISDLKNIWVLANVYESNINKVHLNDDVEVTTVSYPDKKFIGTVDKILNVLDPVSKVMKIRVVLPNENYLLKPEMFTSVTVKSKSDQQAVCIPTSALVFDHSQYYVVLFKSKSDTKIAPVQILNSNEDKTYISKGVKAGDLVIGSNTILIYDALNY